MQKNISITSQLFCLQSLPFSSWLACWLTWYVLSDVLCLNCTNNMACSKHGFGLALYICYICNISYILHVCLSLLLIWPCILTLLLLKHNTYPGTATSLMPVWTTSGQSDKKGKKMSIFSHEAMIWLCEPILCFEIFISRAGVGKWYFKSRSYAAFMPRSILLTWE